MLRDNLINECRAVLSSPFLEDSFSEIGHTKEQVMDDMISRFPGAEYAPAIQTQEPKP